MIVKNDYHIHTHYSDGLYSPQRVIALAKEAGIKSLSVTDHDTLEGLAESEIAAREAGVEFFPGVELTVSVKFNNNNNDSMHQMHLLGYCFDPTNKALNDYLTHFKEKKKERAIGWFYAVMDNIYRKTANEDEFIKMINRKKGIITGYNQAAFLRETLFPDMSIKDISQEYIWPYNGHEYISSEEASKLIHDAGGFVSLAHLGENGRLENGNYREIAEMLYQIKDYIDAIEYFHPHHRRLERRICYRLIENYQLKVTGGSDFHGRKGERLGQLFVPSIVTETFRNHQTTQNHQTQKTG